MTAAEQVFQEVSKLLAAEGGEMHPGAITVPFTDLLNAAGRPQSLRVEFRGAKVRTVAVIHFVSAMLANPNICADVPDSARGVLLLHVAMFLAEKMETVLHPPAEEMHAGTGVAADAEATVEKKTEGGILVPGQ